ncbi:MAG: alpha/beta fold hydrolase [Nocardiopsaceae bacterium]|nr:alpha/beta fold hydrolase [Nocardiopsaceae bacterium]
MSTFRSTFRHPGTVVTDHVFTVPLDHSRPDGDTIEVFAREVVAATRQDADLPWLLFLQGGPGMAAPRPVGRQAWLDRALDDYRVLLLDQRGTGLSSPITARSLASLGPASAQADYLACFRADSIVADAELIRRELAGGAPWSVLGQSFGGFCAVTYLSRHPEGLREVMITGGLPGLESCADDWYRLTYPVVAERTAGHYRRYPGDADLVRRIAIHLATNDEWLPDGSPLTLEAFQSIGTMLGQSDGSHRLHYLLENPFDADGDLSDAFLAGLYPRISFAAAPLYAVLHEACLANEGKATRWAAGRIRSEYPGFDGREALASGSPVLFTGEMIYHWMVTRDPALAPLREAAELLAERGDWPPLYDPARLAANQVPVAAAIYYHDMYVPRRLSVRTAAAIGGLRSWITSAYEHDGLRTSGGTILDRLIAMNRGEV